jgi:hypothetical protein
MAWMEKVGGWHDDPCRGSLGLLPSGPDPVGEWLVHHQPPTFHIGNSPDECKGGSIGMRALSSSAHDLLAGGMAHL